MTPHPRRQRTFKFSVSTDVQLGHLCLVTGSGATAVVEQAVAQYYRRLFGTEALRALLPSAGTALGPSEDQMSDARRRP